MPRGARAEFSFDMNRDLRSKGPVGNELGDEVKRYLEELMESQTEKLMGRITALEEKLLEKDTVIDELNGELAVAKRVNGVLVETVDNLRVTVDDLEQYGRRYAVRIDNIPFKKGETEAELQEKVKGVLKIAGVKVEGDTINRLHRSSPPRVNDEGVTVAQTIVKFRHWAPRRQSHLGRELARKEGFYIRHDLTKRRLALLKRARDLIKNGFDESEEVYAYADINSNLTLRRGPKAVSFNTDAGLDDAIARI